MYFKNLKNNKTKGFTLIELMVSVAIFSIVLLFALGSIISIVDANRKARTLTSVMNDVNFVFENMTRSIKTGREIETKYNSPSCGANGKVKTGSQIEISAIDPTAIAGTFDRINVYYRLCEKDGYGFIEKKVGNSGEYEKITSNDVDVDNLSFKVFADGGQVVNNDAATGKQPRVLVIIDGSVEYVRNVRSEFHIQTTVSQRDLNL